MNAIRALKLIQDKIKTELNFVKKSGITNFVVGQKTAAFLKEQLDLDYHFVGKNFDDLFEIINGHYSVLANDNMNKILCLVGNLSEIEKYKEVYMH